MLHTFLVLYRRPNRLQGQQEVGLSVSHVAYMLLYVFYTPQAAVFDVFDHFSSFSHVAEEFDPEENLHSTDGQSHM